MICKGVFSGCAQKCNGKSLGRHFTCFGGLCCFPLQLSGVCVLCCFLTPFAPFRVVGCRDPHSPGLACLSGGFRDGTHGMHTTQSSSRQPSNSGTHAGNKKHHAKWTHNTHKPASASCEEQNSSPSLALPHADPTRWTSWAKPQTLITPSHTHHAQPPQTFLLQPRRLMHTVQTCTALFPNHYRGEPLESDEFLWLCIGKRAEVDFFSFGTGLVGLVLHPRNCGSFPVSALIHLAGRRLVLGL